MFKLDENKNVWASNNHVYNHFKESILHENKIFQKSEMHNVGDNYITYNFGKILELEGKGNYKDVFTVGVTFDDEKSMFNFWVEVKSHVPFMPGYFTQLDYEGILILLYDLGLQHEPIWTARNYFIDHSVID